MNNIVMERNFFVKQKIDVAAELALPKGKVNFAATEHGGKASFAATKRECGI